MKVQALQHGDAFRFANTAIVEEQCRYAPHPEQVARGIWILTVDRLGNIARYAARPQDSDTLQWSYLALPVQRDTNVVRI